MNTNGFSRHVKNNFTAALLGAVEFSKICLVFVVLVFSFLVSSAHAQNSCSIVKVKTFKQVGSANYYQEGVGWVYGWQTNEKLVQSKTLKVVAPAHVVFEGSKIFADCDGVSLELIPKGISPTLDLAVLESKDVVAKNIKPLFELSANLSPVNIDESVLKDNTSGFPVVVHFNKSTLTYTNLGVVNGDLKTQFNYQFPQYQRSILNASGGIRPGMSGSPLFMANSKLPVGMNLKTKINDHVSLVLPTEDLIQFLPHLEKGLDPWALKHPLFEIGFYHAYDSATKSLQRYRQVLIKNEKGEVIQKYLEPCQFGSMVETSTWQVTGGGGSWGDSGGSWGDSGGSWGDSGGSWGDSGGGKNKAQGKKQTYYTGDLKLAQNAGGEGLLKQIMYLGYNQYFLSKNVCEKEGLIESVMATGGRRLLLGGVMKFDSTLTPMKIDDIESLLVALLAQEKQRGAFVNKIYAGDELASLKLICNEKIMGRNLKAYGSKVDASELTRFIPKRPWNDFDVNQFFKHDANINSHMLLMREKKYLSRGGDSDVVYLECDDDGEQLNIVSKNQDWSYEFKISDGELSGSFSISNIDRTYDVKPKPLAGSKSLWNYLAEDPKSGAKIQVTLDPFNDPLVTIRFLEIPAAEKYKHGHGFNNTTPSLEYMESLWYVQD